MPAVDGFPQLVCCTRLGVHPDFTRDLVLYDVKFWPWATGEEDQVFAVCGSNRVFICRPKLGNNPSYEVLKWWEDKSTSESSYNSIAWTRHAETGKPILCVAGSEPKHITVLDVETGNVIQTLEGHGHAVNDLQISPLSPNILASSSEDYTVRLWNLHPKYAKQPCVAIFAGEGHRQPILAIRFHPNGRWLLTGAMDTAVALWAVPPIEELEDLVAADQEPRVVYYPYFYSTEVHHNYVDCLDFYGDLIISRAARSSTERGSQNDILLWQIEGFDADAPTPKDPPIPYPNVDTRSAFPHEKGLRGFNRVLTFKMPNTDRFYLRFALSPLLDDDARSILAMGSTESKYCFWDLARLEEGHDQSEDAPARGRGRGRGAAKRGVARKTRGNYLATLAAARAGVDAKGDFDMQREASTDMEGTASNTNRSSNRSSVSSTDRSKTSITDPFKPLKPHHEFIVTTNLSKNQHFGTAQMAWSPDGRWLVGVGDNGVVCLMAMKESG